MDRTQKIRAFCVDGGHTSQVWASLAAWIVYHALQAPIKTSMVWQLATSAHLECTASQAALLQLLVRLSLDSTVISIAPIHTVFRAQLDFIVRVRRLG